mmetsp:Transcript_23631/g.56486  ORF Transcript_23631/g.56486 Transcript_23631/m.56486 type:complete len:251 (+) Transcript_23631:351-1103(+)
MITTSHTRRFPLSPSRGVRNTCSSLDAPFLMASSSLTSLFLLFVSIIDRFVRAAAGCWFCCCAACCAMHQSTASCRSLACCIACSASAREKPIPCSSATSLAACPLSLRSRSISLFILSARSFSLFLAPSSRSRNSRSFLSSSLSLASSSLFLLSDSGSDCAARPCCCPPPPPAAAPVVAGARPPVFLIMVIWSGESTIVSYWCFFLTCPVDGRPKCWQMTLHLWFLRNVSMPRGPMFPFPYPWSLAEWI